MADERGSEGEKTAGRRPGEAGPPDPAPPPLAGDPVPVSELASLRARWEQLSKEHARLREDLEQAQRSSSVQAGECVRLRSEAGRLTEERLRLREELRRAQERVAVQAGEIARLRASSEKLREQCGRMKDRARGAEDGIRRQASEINDLVDELWRVSDERSRLLLELESLRRAESSPGGEPSPLPERDRPLERVVFGLDHKLRELQEWRRWMERWVDEAARPEPFQEPPPPAAAPAPEPRDPAREAAPPEPEEKTAELTVRDFEPPLPPAAQETEPAPEAAPGCDPAMASVVAVVRARVSALCGEVRSASAVRPPQLHPARARSLLSSLSRLQDQLKVLEEFFAGHVPAEVQPLAPLVESCLKLWEPSFAKRGVTVLRRPGRDLPPCLAQPQRLRQALHQVLQNAYDAMPRGGCLRVEALRGDEEDVLLCVKDTGGGIPADVLREPSRPHPSEKSGRLGLGLALVHRILHGFGGSLELRNEKGGAAVVFRLTTRPRT